VLVALSGADAPRPWIPAVDRLVTPHRVQLTRAADDRQALARIDAGGVDLAVLCGDAPDFGGLRSLEVVRARFRDLPCLLVAQELTAITLRRALELRAESVVPQPVDAGLLAELMLRILRRRFAGS
jgi:CheY-like chemotaxis protein